MIIIAKAFVSDCTAYKHEAVKVKLDESLKLRAMEIPGLREIQPPLGL